MRVYQFRHIRAVGSEDTAPPAAARARARMGRFASLGTSHAPLSSRGLGRRPLMAETGVRIPVAVLLMRPVPSGAFGVSGPCFPRSQCANRGERCFGARPSGSCVPSPGITQAGASGAVALAGAERPGRFLKTGP